MSMSSSQPPQFVLDVRRPTGAGEILRDRMLTVANAIHASGLADRLVTGHEGLVISGADRLRVLRTVRRAHSDLVAMAEPASHAWHATPSAPFYLRPDKQPSLLPPRTLEDELRDQRLAGASVVILPAGYVSVGDVETARAIVEAANAIPETDVAVPLYLDEHWLMADHVGFLKGLIEASVHPVLLSFGSTTNPLGSKKRLQTYLDIASAGAICWRTDLAGLAGVARGAMGAAIGATPSLRRITPPERNGKARRPDDQTPYVLIPGHLHYMKTKAMRDEIYVSTAAPQCGCAACGDLRIDRFAAEDAPSAARHNHECTAQLARAVLRAKPGERMAVWRKICQDAVVAHQSTAAAIGRDWKPPLDIQVFAEL